MTETAPIKVLFSPDDMLDAYLAGRAEGQKAALRTEDVYDQDADEELTFDAVLAAFDKAGPGDLLRLGDLKPAELHRTLLEAADRRQFVYRTTQPDGWIMSVITSHGTIVMSCDSKGTLKVHVPSPPVGTGTLDLRVQIKKIQDKYRDEDKGWNLETGEQFGAWL